MKITPIICWHLADMFDLLARRAYNLSLGLVRLRNKLLKFGDRKAGLK